MPGTAPVGAALSPIARLAEPMTGVFRALVLLDWFRSRVLAASMVAEFASVAPSALPLTLTRSLKVPLTVGDRGTLLPHGHEIVVTLPVVWVTGAGPPFSILLKVALTGSVSVMVVPQASEGPALV